MTNLVLNIFNTRNPFIYFHTRILDQKVLDVAIESKKSIEIDLSMTPDGEIYIGHPLSFYEYFGLTKPNNLQLDVALDEIKKAGLFLVLDIKNKLLTNKAIEIINYIGSDNCLLHSYVNELVFNESIRESDIEPHWHEEHLPIEEVLIIKNETQVPTVLSCRGINNKFLANSDEDKIIEKIISVVNDNAIAVSLYLHHNEYPSRSIMDKLLEHNILTLINIDVTPIEKRPSLFIGLSDDINEATFTTF